MFFLSNSDNCFLESLFTTHSDCSDDSTFPTKDPRPIKKNENSRRPHKNSNTVIGIKNLGNTCYINSILLCFFFNRPFFNFLNKTKKHTNVFTHSLCNSFHTYWSTSPHSVFDPSSFYSIIKTTFQLFNNNYQHDANEFMLFLFDYLHTQLPPLFTHHYHTFNSKSSKKAWGSHLNVISETVQGQYLRTIKCNYCNHIINNFENFYQISIPPNVSIQDHLRLPTHEILSDYKCDNCKLSNSILSTSILILPTTLIFLIKRFNSPNVINYDLTFIFRDISYELYAICNHTGSTLNSGHYTTYIKYKDIWYFINDEYVTQESPVFKNAYILFYIRSIT